MAFLRFRHKQPHGYTTKNTSREEMIHSYLPNEGRCCIQYIFVSSTIFANWWLRINQIHSHLLSHEHKFKVKYKCPWQHCNYRKCFRRKNIPLKGFVQDWKEIYWEHSKYGDRNPRPGEGNFNWGPEGREGGTGRCAGEHVSWCWKHWDQTRKDPDCGLHLTLSLRSLIWDFLNSGAVTGVYLF